jgi:hypothetical protein
MGAGASVPPGISEELKDKTITLLRSCKNDSGATRTESLRQLWDIGYQQNNRVPLTHPALEFVPTMVWVLENCKPETATIEKCSGAIWCLSSTHECRLHLCQKEFRLIPALMSVVGLNDAIKTNVTNILLNCSIDSRTHNLLLRPEHGYIDYLMTEMRAKPDLGLHYNAFQCLTGDIDAKFIPAIVKSGLPQFIMAKWTPSGSDTNKWGEVAKRCLNILLYISKHAQGADAVRNLNQSQYIYSLLNAKDVQGIKASFLAACVYGREEGNAQMKSLLDTSPHVLPYITSIFAQTLVYDVTTPEGIEVKNLGFVPGVIHVSHIASALKNLSLSEKNKMIIIQNRQLLNHILTAVQAFIDNKSEFGGVYDNMFRPSGGGGGDIFSLELFLELLLQLSFYYDDDETMRASFNSFGSLTLSSVLDAVINLDSSRNVSFEATQFAKQLLARFRPTKQQALLLPVATLVSPSAPSSPSKPSNNTATTRPSHIMLSYAWGCNKNHVIALGKKLRELGYDVWRDEEGSSIVHTMSGDIVETMADAIQHAHTVVICVSAQYKDSANCRAEAKYAHARSNQTKDSVKLIYVMMDEQYHTRSSPRQVDGWLGFMVGTEMWYPLWDANQVDRTASALAELIGNNAKLAANETFLNLRGGETTSTSTANGNNNVSTKTDDYKNSNTSNNASTFASPVASSSRKMELIPQVKPTGPPDCQAAFVCLEKKKANHPHALEGLMEDLGLAAADDLGAVEPEDWMLLCLTLKKPQQKAFLEALRLDNSALPSIGEPGSGADWSAAWNCLDVKRAKYSHALHGALIDFGAEKAEDLSSLDGNDLVFIAMSLKKPQQKAYYAAIKL